MIVRHLLSQLIMFLYFSDLVSDAKKRSSPIVGQYCVDIESFEELAIPVLDVEVLYDILLCLFFGYSGILNIIFLGS